MGIGRLRSGDSKVCALVEESARDGKGEKERKKERESSCDVK